LATRKPTQAAPDGVAKFEPVDRVDKGAVQSVNRALDLLEAIADASSPRGLSQLAASAALPLPTAHRLMQTLIHRGYARQEQSRHYTLGAKLIHLGDVASRLLGAWATPFLAELRDFTGESANFAILDDNEVVYVAQAASRHQMRMFTEPGRRVLPHCTAVGKALLAELPKDGVQRIVERNGLPARTARTITDVDEFVSQLKTIHRRGYALDEGEQEVGVRCLAVVVPNATVPSAISVSGPAARMTAEHVKRSIPVLHEIAGRLSVSLAESDPESG
jgi:IclR family transcriptional regulator, acetate operon repressor